MRNTSSIYIICHDRLSVCLTHSTKLSFLKTNRPRIGKVCYFLSSVSFHEERPSSLPRAAVTQVREGVCDSVSNREQPLLKWRHIPRMSSVSSPPICLGALSSLPTLPTRYCPNLPVGQSAGQPVGRSWSVDRWSAEYRSNGSNGAVRPIKSRRISARRRRRKKKERKGGGSERDLAREGKGGLRKCSNE